MICFLLSKICKKKCHEFAFMANKQTPGTGSLTVHHDSASQNRFVTVRYIFCSDPGGGTWALPNSFGGDAFPKPAFAQAVPVTHRNRASIIAFQFGCILPPPPCPCQGNFSKSTNLTKPWRKVPYILSQFYNGKPRRRVPRASIY